MTYVAPQLDSRAFNCPYCGAFAHQVWSNIYRHAQSFEPIHSLKESRCAQCNAGAFWHNGVLVVPDGSTAPLPHPDMPDQIKADFEEARSVFSRSPRSSAALLRLAIQKLCQCLGKKGENLNADVGVLVKEGLPVQVQQALDIVRVIGNHQVHPGEIDVRDDPNTAGRL